VLAFCEARGDTGSDWSDVDLVLRRSLDGGRTWTAMQIIADAGPLTAGNPCPVVDRSTGTIWLPFCRGSKPGRGNAEILLMKSIDDGKDSLRPKKP
jgi:sialidase-1